MEKVKSVCIKNEEGEHELYEVGKNGVIEITEHSAKGEGDKWFYDVITEKEVIRVFDFIEVRLTKE